MSADVRARHRLPGASSVQAALAALLRQDIVTKEDGRYVAVDSLVSRVGRAARPTEPSQPQGAGRQSAARVELTTIERALMARSRPHRPPISTLLASSGAHVTCAGGCDVGTSGQGRLCFGGRRPLGDRPAPANTLTPVTTDGITAGASGRMKRTTSGVGPLAPPWRCFTVPVNGSGAARLLLCSERTGGVCAASLTPDQRTMVVIKPGNATGPDLWTFDLANPKTAVLHPLVPHAGKRLGRPTCPPTAGGWRISPTCQGNTSSMSRPLPAVGQSGVSHPTARERRSGRRTARSCSTGSGSDIHVVAVSAGGAFTWAPPRKLLSGAFSQQGGPGDVNYDISADGQRFLMIEEAAPGRTVPQCCPRLAIVTEVIRLGPRAE